MIIGITGTNAAGKDTVADLLVKKFNWPLYSLSDQLRLICREKGIAITRKNLQNLGNQVRQDFGGDYLSRMILKNTSSLNFIVTSIRNPAEIEPFKAKGDFFLIAVDADPKIRYSRVQFRNRGEESKLSYKDFMAEEERELTGSPLGQQLLKLIDMADVKIINDGSIDELYDKVIAGLKRINYGKS